MADLSIDLYETITITESLQRNANPLIIQPFETITITESLRSVAPAIVEISLYETISVKDVRPALSSPVLVIRAFEAITVTEGPLNKGVRGGATVIGPAPAPITIPADYWEVGV